MAEFNLKGIGEIIAEAKASYAKFKRNRDFDGLLEEYSRLIEKTELLKDEIEKLKGNDLTPEKVQSLGMAMNLLGITGFDSENMEKIKELKKFGDELKTDKEEE